MFLSPAELQSLTGYKRSSDQRAKLDRMGVPHFVNAKGRPVVLANWDKPRQQPMPERRPMEIPHLDREAVFRPLSEIRASRRVYTLGSGDNTSGVYFLFLRWALLYVGQSVYVASRLRAHFMRRVDDPKHAIWFNKVAVIEVPQYWLNEVEYHYINKHLPPFNVKLHK